MYIASWKGHDQIVELLLRREANVNHQTKVRPPMLVCELLHEECGFFNVRSACITMSKVISHVPSNRLGYKHQDIIRFN